MCADNLKRELTQTTNTGNSLPISKRSFVLRRSNAFSETLPTPNLHDRPQPKIMCAKKTQPLPVHASNLEQSLEQETPTKIGMQSGLPLQTVEFRMCHLTYEFVTTETSAGLQWTIANLLHKNGLSMYITAIQALGKVAEPGTKQAWKLILRIPAPNFGTDTMAKITWLLTNFAEESTSATYSDGSIDTPY